MLLHMNGRLSIFVRYIRMLYPGRFILIISVFQYFVDRLMIIIVTSFANIVGKCYSRIPIGNTPGMNCVINYPDDRER